MLVLVTGGAGYLGSTATLAIMDSGHEVRVLDNLLHGQQHVADALRARGADVHVGDLRDQRTRRRALRDVDTLVHLAAIVGDPACATHPELSEEVNIAGSSAIFSDASRGGVQHLVFASTCSNYGVVSGGSVVDEDSPLRPASAYARQKVQTERDLLDGPLEFTGSVTCLRFATLYGVSSRMRFDLLVNEFVRDLWLGRTIQVYGGDSWRPYVHVRDAAASIVAAIEKRHSARDRRVFNVGVDQDNYRKEDIADLIAGLVGSGSIERVDTGPDPRSYRVSFERVSAELGPELGWSVEAGVQELMNQLAGGRFGDAMARDYVNS